MKYKCMICGYIYDEAKEGKAFEDLPESWQCPICKASKSSFVPEEENQTVAAVNREKTHYSLKKLSSKELSSVCSNLARGCEKQYKEEESKLFTELADYFLSISPAEENADVAHLSDLIIEDINEKYPDLKSIAEEHKDRGTQRICVWGEKVTRMLSSIMEGYKKDGEDFLKDTDIWVCTTCGFVYLGNKAPSICPVCKVPDWKFEKVEGRSAL